MVFSSLTFIYAFLPIVLVLYFVCPARVWRNGVLLVASLVFYAWGEPKFVLVMLVSSVCAYVGGRLIDRYGRQDRPRAKKCALVISIVVLLGFLFVFKYLKLFADTLGAVIPGMPSFEQLVLPIGISFYTFQVLSYIIDLYRGKVAVQKNYFYLLLYICLFPQLIAGPIVRYETVEHEIRQRKENWSDFIDGLERVIFGLAKKVLLANTMAVLVDGVYAMGVREAGTVFAWIATLAYTFQIYFDFSGYSDIAIGLGRMFGFHFRENFNYPYMATSISEFWRRWHISLGSWFRDYVYIPLGGNRVSKPRHLFNILVVWGLTGLWHGAQWSFLLWGLYFGVLIILEHFVLKKLLDKLPNFVKWAGTFFLVVLGRVFFYNESLTATWEVFKVLFSWIPVSFVTVIGGGAESNTAMIPALMIMPLAFLFCFPVFRRFVEAKGLVVSTIRLGVCLVLLVLTVMFLISSSYNPFIYFRF